MQRTWTGLPLAGALLVVAALPPLAQEATDAGLLIGAHAELREGIRLRSLAHDLTFGLEENELDYLHQPSELDFLQGDRRRSERLLS